MFQWGSLHLGLQMTRRLEVVVSWRVGQIDLHWVGSQCTQPPAKNVNTIRGRGEKDGKNPESFKLQEAKAIDEAWEIAKMLDQGSTAISLDRL